MDDAKSKVALGPPRLSDLGLIYRLVLEGAREGVFTSDYVRPTFRAGLGIQLMTTFFLQRIKYPDGWHDATLRIVRVCGDFAGFSLLVDHEAKARSLAMMAVMPEYRNRKLGSRLLRDAIATLQSGMCLHVECLPKSKVMRHMLKKSGFSRGADRFRARRAHTETHAYLLTSRR